MSLLCLLAAGAALGLSVPADGFELRWIHSVERTEWRERWVPATDGRLHLTESRVRGSGAGMEPAEGSVLVDGWWIDHATRRSVPALTLPLSPYAPPYHLCLGEDCRRLDALLPEGAQSATLTATGPCPMQAPWTTTSKSSW